MSIYLEIVNLDEVFHSLASTPLIVNGVNILKKEEKERLNKLLYTHYDGDTLDIIPSCNCGAIRGEYNLGIRCNECGTEVSSITERPLQSLLWIAAPEGVKSLMNPMCWTILSQTFTVRNCNLIEYLTNPDYKPPVKAGMLSGIPEEWPRSFNFFVENFDQIIALLLARYGTNKTPQFRYDFMEFISRNREKIFCQYIPFPSRLGFITESTPVGTYVDTTIKDAIDAIRTITSISASVTPVSLRSKEAKVAKTIAQLATYYETFMKKTIGGKPGVFRKHIFGSRGHFTARAVITSIPTEHDYDEIHLPWGVAVQLLRTHLTNKLLKLDYTPNQITAMFYESVNRYNPVLDQLFKELIAESPYKGIPISLGRNPTLARGSVQLFYVTKIKTDLSDNAISLSVLVIRQSNMCAYY